MTLNAVEVRNADAGAPLARLSGDSLWAATSLATSPDAPTVQLPPSSVAVVWMEIAIQPKRIPKAITRHITIDPLPDVSTAAVPLTYTGTVVEVDRRPPIVVGHPLAGARWAALGSCCDGPHRRALYPIDGRWYLAQRFAIDFNQREADNRPGTGDPALPTSFPTFGQPCTRSRTALSSWRSTAIRTSKWGSGARNLMGVDQRAVDVLGAAIEGG